MVRGRTHVVIAEEIREEIGDAIQFQLIGCVSLNHPLSRFRQIENC